LIDIEGLNLFDLRKSKKTSEQDYEEIEKLESKKRGFLRELQNVKDQLAVVFKSETFNDTTGKNSFFFLLFMFCSVLLFHFLVSFCLLFFLIFTLFYFVSYCFIQSYTFDSKNRHSRNSKLFLTPSPTTQASENQNTAYHWDA
jgi:hypothetical protein